MPITELTAEQKGLLARAGINPDDYVYDDSTGEAVSVASLGAPSTGETLKEAGKSFVRGASSSVSEPMEFAGRLGKVLSEIPGADFLLGPGARTTGPLGSLLQRKTEELAPRDPRMSNLGPVAGFMAEDVPGALGQLASVLVPGAVAAKSGITAAPILARAGVALAGAMGEGEQTAEAEMSRQRQAGEQPDELAAVLKGTAVAPIAGVLESKLGAGRLVEKLAGSKAGEALLGQAIRNVATGGLEEGSQQALQDLIVNHQIDAKNLVKPILLGGIVQGGAGTAIDVANRATGNVEGAPTTLPSLDDAANFDVGGVSRTPTEEQIDAPPVIDKPIGPAVTPTEMEAIMTIAKTGGAWTPANATDGDKAIATLIKNKVPLTPDIINEVFSLANNQSERGKEALNTRVREHSINAMVAKQMQPPTAGDILKGETKQAQTLNKLSQQRLNQEKEIEKLETKLQDSTLTASARYLAQQKLGRFRKTLDDVDTEIASILGADVKPDLGVQVAQRPRFFSAGPADRLDTEPSVRPDPEFGTEFRPQSAQNVPAADAPLSSIPTQTTYDTGMPNRAVALLPAIPGQEGTTVPQQSGPAFVGAPVVENTERGFVLQTEPTLPELLKQLPESNIIDVEGTALQELPYKQPAGLLTRGPIVTPYSGPKALLPERSQHLLRSGPFDPTAGELFLRNLQEQARTENPYASLGPLTEAEVSILQAYRQQLEGEQSLPFINRRE